MKAAMFFAVQKKEGRSCKGLVSCWWRGKKATNRAARGIVGFCKENGIDTLVYGHNKRQKDGINIGKQNNQALVRIPSQKLCRRLQQLCLNGGIRLVAAGESYTFKGRHQAGD
jgi:IS605 OrfB family transposase